MQQEAYEDRLNKLLDALGVITGRIDDTCDQLEKFIDQLEELTRSSAGEEITEEALKEVNKLIGICNTLTVNLSKDFSRPSKIRKTIPAAYKKYRALVDDFSEVVEDVRIVFFESSKNEELQFWTKKIESLN
ncbi:MAG: hypothetical protein ACPF8V_07285 [Luteibaculum sp.]